MGLGQFKLRRQATGQLPAQGDVVQTVCFYPCRVTNLRAAISVANGSGLSAEWDAG